VCLKVHKREKFVGSDLQFFTSLWFRYSLIINDKFQKPNFFDSANFREGQKIMLILSIRRTKVSLQGKKSHKGPLKLLK